MHSSKKIIEKVFGVKVNNKVNLIVIFCVLLFLSVCFSLIPKFSKIQTEKLNENWNKSEFSGTVDSLNIDYSSHAATNIYFKNGSKKSNLPQSYYYAIKKNDYIFKLKNNDTVFISRKNKIIKLK